MWPDSADLVGETDPPRRAGGELLAVNESVVQPAVHGGGNQAQFPGGPGHGEQFSFLRVAAGPAAGNVIAEPRCLDSSRGAGQSLGGAPVLPVEDARDLRVGVVDGQPADQVDGVLVSAEL